MSEDPPFDRTPPVATGQVDYVSPLVRRVVAPNPGPFTFTGTCSYIVGRGTVAIVDPGPDDPGHVERLLAATAGETVAAILGTHTHRDHSPAVAALREATGATSYGAGPHRPARPLETGETLLDASADLRFVPDVALADGETVEGGDWRLQAI